MTEFYVNVDWGVNTWLKIKAQNHNEAGKKALNQAKNIEFPNPTIEIGHIIDIDEVEDIRLDIPEVIEMIEDMEKEAMKMATVEEKKTALEPFKIKDDTTIEELRTMWKGAYGVVGHKVLGRILLGQSEDEALHLNGS